MNNEIPRDPEKTCKTCGLACPDNLSFEEVYCHRYAPKLFMAKIIDGSGRPSQMPAPMWPSVKMENFCGDWIPNKYYTDSEAFKANSELLNQIEEGLKTRSEAIKDWEITKQPHGFLFMTSEDTNCTICGQPREHENHITLNTPGDPADS